MSDAKADARIFVFGSNLAGRHGKGAALYARQMFGAVYGQGSGAQGHSYAVPTKDQNLSTLPVSFIKTYVDGFLFYARAHRELRFHVTRIGCGLAGYADYQIAPLFKDAPANCDLPLGWRAFSLLSDRSPTPLDQRAFQICYETERAQGLSDFVQMELLAQTDHLDERPRRGAALPPVAAPEE